MKIKTKEAAMKAVTPNTELPPSTQLRKVVFGCSPVNTHLVCLLHLAGALSTATLLHAQGTAFTYQGRLNVNGAPASGTYDFRYRLAFDPYGNNYMGSSVLASGQVVSNGLFTAELDFGAGAFNGSNYWLEIDVRTNGAGGYTALNPLQPVTSAPYAIFSRTASNALNATTAATASAVGADGVNGVALQNNAVTSPKIAGGQVVKSLTAGASTLYDDVTMAAGNNVTITPSGNTLTIAATGGSVADGSITTAKLADGAVTSSKVGDGSITDTKLGNGAVTSSKIQDGATTSAKLADNAVTAAKIMDNAVTSAKIMDGTVVAGDIGSGQVVKSLNSLNDDVTLVEGANVTITPSGNTLTIAASRGSVPDGSITTSKLADGAVTSTTLGDGSITDTKLGNGAVTSSKIADGAITSAKLADNAVTAARIVDNAVTSAKIMDGTVVAGDIGSGQVVKSLNSLKDDVTLVPGANVTITPSGNTLIIAASAGGWSLTGNAGTTPGQDFLGTTDNQPVEFWAYGRRALRLEPTGFNGSGTPNVIGGSPVNYVTSGVEGATIGGGGDHSGQTNSVTQSFGTVAGGLLNTASGNYATVGGGQRNSAIGINATVSGGSDNTAGGAAVANATVGGGAGNIASTNYATVGGGANNTASGRWATVPGGQMNLASGRWSFAAGRNAQAINDGSFVWSDGSASTTSTADNQFMVRALGGVIIYSDSGTAAGVSLAAGSSTWGNLSDRNAKENFAPVTPQQVLAKVAELPITKWSYKTEQGVRHIGPMAQDFYAAFGVGEDDRHITTVDEGGVALAAIQGLNMKLQEKDAEIQALKGRLEKLERALSSSTGNR